MQMLEQSLRRLQTDHLDLWQVHGVVFQNDPELFIRPGGAAEALLKAKQQGKYALSASPATKTLMCISPCSTPAFPLTLFRCR